MGPEQGSNTGQVRDAATLAELRRQNPHLRITAESCGPGHVWVARGQAGHPWIVVSDDIIRFRRAITGG
jgi:uncharacterized protein (DUF736 family)